MSPDNHQYKGIEALSKVISEALKLDTDILAECFAALVTDESMGADIHILPVANKRRNYNQDITNIEFPTSDENDRNIIKIMSSRPGILNYLPETFYISPDEKFSEKKDEPLELRNKRLAEYDAKIERQEESAYKFFTPLDVAYNKVRISRELEEVALLENPNLLLKELWLDFPCDTQEEQRFINTLHLLPYVIGHIDRTKYLIEYVLGNKVNLAFNIRKKTKLSNKSRLRLGSGILGYSFNIGKHTYEHVPLCKITILELDKKVFAEFKNSESKISKLLKNIEKYYFELGSEVTFDFKVSKALKPFARKEDNKKGLIASNQWQLSRDIKTGNGILGYSTCIGKFTEV